MNRPFSANNLRNFCENILPNLEKESILFLAITGDFTDGIGSFVSLSDRFGQQQADWDLYMEATSNCRKLSVPIFTIRGNHDCFGVSSFGHASNKHFVNMRLHTHKQKNHDQIIHHHSGSYAFAHNSSMYLFVEAGRIVPSHHQFYGEISKEIADWISQIVSHSTHAHSTQLYVFCHYPLGALTPDSRKRLVDSLSAASSVTYLSGHIHSLVGSNGVQAIRSHGFIDELQLADFKWTGLVRKVHVNTGMFVDIPTLSRELIGANILYDPSVRYGSNRHSILSVYSQKKLIAAGPSCVSGGETKFPPITLDIPNTFFFDIQDSSSVDTSVCLKFNDSTQIIVHSTDTRLLGVKTYVFVYFFEFLQTMLLIVYLILVYVARRLYNTHHLRTIPIYFVLAPLIPTSLGEWLVDRKWMAANGIGFFDLETFEFFLDSETTRVGIFLVLYLLCAIALYLRLTYRNRWTVAAMCLLVLVPVTLVDMRMAMARGGIRTLLLSPHTWFICYYWFTWKTGTNKIKRT